MLRNSNDNTMYHEALDFHFECISSEIYFSLCMVRSRDWNRHRVGFELTEDLFDDEYIKLIKKNCIPSNHLLDSRNDEKRRTTYIQCALFFQRCRMCKKNANQKKKKIWFSFPSNSFHFHSKVYFILRMIIITIYIFFDLHRWNFQIEFKKP